MSNAIVFNIQGYSIHDGPGIRTTVFLKGCPLRCQWCQNPESQTSQCETFIHAELCEGCEGCVEPCPRGAREVVGRAMSVAEVFAELAKESLFYAHSGGGVTLSGGEPLFSPAFAAELLARCKQAGWHTALDTCGYASWHSVCQVLEHVDLVLFDLKHMDSRQHFAGTGMPNERILENARRICHELRVPMWARIPVIPGYNDSTDNMTATARFIAEELSPSLPVYLHPYHRFGEGKWEQFRRPAAHRRFDPPAESHLHGIRRLFESRGLNVFRGGEERE